MMIVTDFGPHTVSLLIGRIYCVFRHASGITDCVKAAVFQHASVGGELFRLQTQVVDVEDTVTAKISHAYDFDKNTQLVCIY